MATHAFNLPSPYQSEMEELDRRQKLAEVMQSQSFQPIQRYSYGGIEAPVSPLSGLAKLLQAYTGAKEQREIAAERKSLGVKQQKDMADTLAEWSGLMTGSTGVGGIPDQPAVLEGWGTVPPRTATLRGIELPMIGDIAESKLSMGGAPEFDPRKVITPAVPGRAAIPATKPDPIGAAQALMKNPATFGLGAELLMKAHEQPKKSPLVKVQTRNDKGESVSKWIREDVLETMGDVPEQYTGFIADVIQAKNLPNEIANDQRLISIIGSKLNKDSGAVTQEDVANYLLKIAEARARLGHEGIQFAPPVVLKATVNPLTGLPSGIPAGAVDTGKVSKDGKRVYTFKGKNYVEDN